MMTNPKQSVLPWFESLDNQPASACKSPSDTASALPTRRQAVGHLSQAVGGLWLASQLAGSAPAQAPARRIKVGQIGTQHAHASKFSVYRKSPDYEIVGIVEADEEARHVAQQNDYFQGVPWLTEKELLSTPGLEAVLVETPVRDLLSTAQRAIDAGKHVHLDKPAGNDAAEFERLIASARQKKLLVQMGYMYRYNPAVLLLHEFLKKGWLGDVIAVHASIGKLLDADARRAQAEFSGGIMFELGCHMIDLVIGVIGSGSRLSVFNQRLGSDGLCDNSLIVFEKGRLLATVKANALEIEGGSRRQLTVVGTRGTFHIQPIDVPAVTISLAEAQGEYKKGLQTQSWPTFVRYSADAADMASILRGEKTADYSYEHDLEVQRCVLAR